jgi:hypothetical protein
MSEKLMLGNTDIGRFFENNNALDTERREELENVLEEEVSGGKLGSEDIPVRILKLQINGYRAVDLSFLSMASRFEINDAEIGLPRFAVYPVTNERLHSFYIKAMDLGDWVYAPRVEIKSEQKLPRMFTDELVKALDFGGQRHIYEEHGSNYCVYDFSFIPWKIGKSYKRCEFFSKSFKTDFIGMVPSQIKRKIEAANEIFSEGNVYLIAEVLPNQWKVADITKDALVVGTIPEMNKCFLIDHFKTVSFENGNADEYIKI